MVQLRLAVIVGLVGLSLAYPSADQLTKTEEVDQQVTPRQGGLASVLGSIGTALVPVFGAVLGPILTNLAQGISTAFNNGLNVSTNRTPSAEAQALLIRIPKDSPLYAALLQGQLLPLDVEGLPAVSASSSPASGKNPLDYSGKLGGKYGPFPQSDADVPFKDVAEPILTIDADVPEIPTSPVKRVPQRKRTETEYA